jgi:hypothetical protein
VFLGLVVFAILYHFGFGHSGRLAGLPEGKSVLVAGRVAQAPQASPNPDGGGAGRRVCIVEDLLGFVEVHLQNQELELPALGHLVVFTGKKKTFQGKPIVEAEKEMARH